MPWLRFDLDAGTQVHTSHPCWPCFWLLSGEAALTFAGVWDFETGLRAVQLRGELMEVLSARAHQLASCQLADLFR